MAILDKQIREQPAIKELLSKMPDHIAQSFDDEQLSHLLTAVGTRKWGKHSVDFRGTFKFPLIKWRFYYVVLAGKNSRELSRKEKSFSLVALAVITSLFIILSTLLGILVLYLLKSALGIDIFPNFSFGVWGWFKGLFD